MDPKNTAAQNQITLIRRKRKETKEQEKKLYASIFSKMAKASEKVTSSIPLLFYFINRWVFLGGRPDLEERL